MSFSSLPPELVHQIIESTVPHTFHSSTYTERQSTLCSLSLVSKIFRSIAQPLLFEIIKLKRLGNAGNLQASGSAGGSARTRGRVSWLVIEGDHLSSLARTQEEDDCFARAHQLLAGLRNLTASGLQQRSFEMLLPICSNCGLTLSAPQSPSLANVLVFSSALTYLQLTYCPWKEPGRIYLPNLRDLTIWAFSPKFFHSIVDPEAVPNLRNFAFVDADPSPAASLSKLKIDLLLPQLDTLTLYSEVWLSLGSAALHSVASRTLVDFYLDDVAGLDDSVASVVHVRLCDASSRSQTFSHDELQAHLDKWSTFIRENPSLALQSIYLDNLLRPTDALPTATRLCLETLIGTCQERKIEIVFEALPADIEIGPYISTEFVRRQVE
ncbi:hypothetical protein JCM3765_005790 [Sporobolomyces pararoseus]